MLSDILHEIIVSLIVAGLGALYKLSCSPKPDRSQQAKKDHYSPRTIKMQFWLSLFVFSLSIGVIFSVKLGSSFSWLGVLKCFALLFALISFVLLWGAFDAAFAFYPGDDIIEVPAENEAPDIPSQPR